MLESVQENFRYDVAEESSFSNSILNSKKKKEVERKTKK